MNPKVKITLLLVILFLFIFAIGDASAQCAMCRSTVENNVNDGEVSVAANLNMGILYMFVAPYVLFGVIAYMWYRKSRKNGKRIKTTGYSRG